MKNASVSEKKLTIPTYGVGKPQKAPMFFEKRVYQGSSGKVYPNPVTEKIFDEKKDVVYDAVVLENDFVEVVVLPALGGRIYYAIDKTNGYDFVYRNRVIKPALVGLLGPWISGGIEFNWPQHHRPTTYLPVNYKIGTGADGSAWVYVGETERMFGLRQITCIKLYRDKSYIEISTEVYNGEDSTRTFLWWANPAYKVNDDTVTVMPPDVNAVMDHGKRAVSTFPVATGEYYKMDYSKGVDISRYKNIPVPTSFMAYKSEFDFIGGYDYGKKAGLLHVADHLVSPGKKQWTWGCGDFGKAWDRNLTDEDGPYVELMTGCFTDNQPDFTFIEPHDSKRFCQYFMPYHDVGRILNADENVCFGCEDGVLTIYASAALDLCVAYCAADGSSAVRTATVAPCQSVTIDSVDADQKISVRYGDREVVHDPDRIKKFGIPDPATECPDPADCSSTEELYLFGRHIEQYRHATRNAEDYYIEGLRRDPLDLRLNIAYGESLYNRGQVERSIGYFENAVKKATMKNGNPQDADCFYHLAKAQFYLGRYDEAYENFGRCLWGNRRGQGLFFLAAIEKIRGRRPQALDYLKQCLDANPSDTVARNFYASLLSRTDPAAGDGMYDQVLASDPLNAVAAWKRNGISALRRVSAEEIRTVAGYWFATEDYDFAAELLNAWKEATQRNNLPVDWYLAYAKLKGGREVARELDEILNTKYDEVTFAVSLTDKKVLEGLRTVRTDYLLEYHLGNLEYDKKNYGEGARHWAAAEGLKPDFAVAKRNLALYYFNKKKDSVRALACMEAAFASEPQNSRFLFELCQLYAICGKDASQRLALLRDHLAVTEDRDDLYAEYLGLLADQGEAERALDLMENRRFHPWEGGEGKVTKLYKRLKCLSASAKEEQGDYGAAEKLLKDCLYFPENLGEGKLILDYDNDVWYRLGNLYEKTGDTVKARQAYRLATRGEKKVADDLYYNDNPIDYIYYAALAAVKLGDRQTAKEIARSFSEYAERNKGKHIKIDYFAVSLPDLLVWEQDLDEKNNRFCALLKKLSDNIMQEVTV